MERIRKDPSEARNLVRGNDTAALEAVIARFLDAKDETSLNALGWEAVAALPAASKAAKRLEAHVLVSGVMAKA